MGKSQSDILREEIDQKIDQGIDMTDSKIRNEYLADLCNRRSEFDITKARTMVLKITKERYDKRGYTSEVAKLSRKPYYKFNVKLNEEITGRKLERRKKQNESSQNQQRPAQNQDLLLEQQPIPKPPQEFTQRTIKYTHWTPERVGEVFQALLLPFTRKYPELKLDKEQKRSIGYLWLPTFQMFGSEYLQFLGLPTLGAIGILSSKDSKKEDSDKEQIDTEFYN